MSNRTKWMRILALLMIFALAAAACGSDSSDGETSTAPEEDEAPSGDVRNVIVVDKTVGGVTAGDDISEAITPAAGADRGNVDGTLTIGSVLPSSGDLAVLGEPMNKAVELAIADINEAGGVLDGDVVLDARDSGTDEQVASDAVDGLLGTPTDVIVGAASSRISLSVIDKITGAGVPECSPSNTGLDFTTYEDGGYYFRTAPPDNLQAKVMADELIIPDGPESVAIIALADSYGQGFAGALETELTNAGLEVPANIPYDPNGTNFDSDVAELADTGADAYVLWGFPDTGSTILSAMIENGIGPADTQIYAGDGMQSSSLGQLVDPSNPAIVAGIKGTAPSAAPPDGEPTFPDRFAEFAPGVDTIFSAHAYDCTIVFALAALEAGSDDPLDIAGSMNAVTEGGEKCTNFADCKALIEAGTDIDYDGASGALDFVNAGEPGAGAYDIWNFSDETEPAE
ncbi:MAG TPA: ABC transporter substrate-binding protein [Acidimicrobiales bacterium]|nr:ABC transporter substrate-binding protein [Acidimicrobiales bacterium]